MENLGYWAMSETIGFTYSMEAPNPKHEIRNSKQSLMTKIQMIQTIHRIWHGVYGFVSVIWNIWYLNLFRISIFGFRIWPAAIQ
ncbi:MAG: hypothetical protein CVU64_09185 [Deltaproteobacteria bacterium HGW-Deltaproteobacteria-21]|nr:MAG: hypothetical protein CVU64_09185 [Deltaproteobacteria bacterium HGW-Deltaproteobacteria-21]